MNREKDAHEAREKIGIKHFTKHAFPIIIWLLLIFVFKQHSDIKYKIRSPQGLWYIALIFDLQFKHDM